jgi:hypothetical protein
MHGQHLLLAQPQRALRDCDCDSAFAATDRPPRDRVFACSLATQIYAKRRAISTILLQACSLLRLQWQPSEKHT